MKRYEILEHRADLKIRAFGKTKEKLFQNMLLGMSQSQKAEIKNKRKIKREIKIKSSDLPSLLVDFLSEVLYLTQIDKEVYSNVRFEKLSDAELKAELLGQKIERFEKEIKGVTYHSLEICQKKDKTWEATLLLDV